MEKESLLGLTEENIKDSIKTIKNTDMDCSFGQMEDVTRVNGTMENNMVLEFILEMIINLVLENGKMEKE